jgi:hypothetical protein
MVNFNIPRLLDLDDNNIIYREIFKIPKDDLARELEEYINTHDISKDNLVLINKILFIVSTLLIIDQQNKNTEKESLFSTNFFESLKPLIEGL